MNPVGDFTTVVQHNIDCNLCRPQIAMIVIAAIFTVPCLTDKGEQTALYEIRNKRCIH